MCVQCAMLCFFTFLFDSYACTWLIDVTFGERLSNVMDFVLNHVQPQFINQSHVHSTLA